jgi:hypothetical protein
MMNLYILQQYKSTAQRKLSPIDEVSWLVGWLALLYQDLR